MLELPLISPQLQQVDQGMTGICREHKDVELKTAFGFVSIVQN
jgi:hypothetical protein